VPRCILGRFEGVSESNGEREPSGEILSVAKDLSLERYCGVSDATPRGKSPAELGLQFVALFLKVHSRLLWNRPISLDDHL
jgi:hypothetical protein